MNKIIGSETSLGINYQVKSKVVSSFKLAWKLNHLFGHHKYSQGSAKVAFKTF